MLTKFLTDLFRPNLFWWQGPKFLKQKKNIQNIFNTDILFKDESNDLKTTTVNIATSNGMVCHILSSLKTLVLLTD